MNQLLDGKFVSVEVNKEVFAQIRKYKGQSYIDNDEVKILNLDGITVKPRIRNIYLKPTTKNEEHITEGSDRVSEEIGGEEGVPTTPVESVLPDPVHPASDLPRGSDFSL